MHLIIPVLAILVAGFVGYFTGYMKKKGENLATHEDINKLLEKVSAVTAATKQIDAKISNDVWERQRRWELKREVLFEIARKLATLDDALVSLKIALNMTGDQFLEARVAALKKWNKATTDFDEIRLLVGILCGKELKAACGALRFCTNDIVTEFKKDPSIYQTSPKLATDLAKNIFAVKGAIRAELGIKREET
jgi:hypothetical protein